MQPIALADLGSGWQHLRLVLLAQVVELVGPLVADGIKQHSVFHFSSDINGRTNALEGQQVAQRQLIALGPVPCALLHIEVGVERLLASAVHHARPQSQHALLGR